MAIPLKVLYKIFLKTNVSESIDELARKEGIHCLGITSHQEYPGANYPNDPNVFKEIKEKLEYCAGNKKS